MVAQIHTQTRAETLYYLRRKTAQKTRPVGSCLVCGWLYASSFELYLGQCHPLKQNWKSLEMPLSTVWRCVPDSIPQLGREIHTGYQRRNTTLLPGFLYKGTRLTIRMLETTQSAWRRGGEVRELWRERMSVAKQTESRERLSASQQCSAITTERKHKMETLPSPLSLQWITQHPLKRSKKCAFCI